MKQEQEETTIRELFQQLKQEDERDAPSFADSWAAAQSRLEERAPEPIAPRSIAQSRSRLRWSFAAAAAILIACGFIVYRTIPNGSPKDRVVIRERAPEPTPPIKRETQVEKSAIEPEPRRGLRAPRSRRGNRPQLKPPSTRDDSITADAEESKELTDFIMLRYGDDHEPMESGEVIRVQMPRSALITLGLPVNVERADELVMADLLISEDGLARAIRFVQ